MRARRAALRALTQQADGPFSRHHVLPLRALSSGKARETLAEKNTRLREASEARLEETRQQLYAHFFESILSHDRPEALAHRKFYLTPHAPVSVCLGWMTCQSAMLTWARYER